MPKNDATRTEVLIIGAGAAGLMAARELAKAGKSVVMLEARDRIGGRIFPLSQKDFGYGAQGGGEFVHGAAPVTRSLITEAGLSYLDVETDSETWISRNGKLVREDDGSIPGRHMLEQKLKELKNDMPIEQFLDKYFPKEQYAAVRKSITGMVEGFDAADAHEISSFALRDEWLNNNHDWQQGRIAKEGYTALLKFFASECKKYGVAIYFSKKVAKVTMHKNTVSVGCSNGENHEAEKVIVTVPIPIIPSIKLSPAIPKTIDAAAKISFGSAIKILLKFKDQWWIDASGQDLSKLGFLRSDEIIRTWWTQYPESQPTLTGWLAGPSSLKFKNTSGEKLRDIAITSLSNIFKVGKSKLKKDLLHWEVINWPADPFAKGAYSYWNPASKKAYLTLKKPIKKTLFFAGEATRESDSATVEGALASGKEVAGKILH